MEKQTFEDVISRYMVERPQFLQLSRKKYLLTLCKECLYWGPVSHEIYSTTETQCIWYSDIRDLLAIKMND